MAWNSNPEWTPQDVVNGGEQFTEDDLLTPEDINTLVENMQYLYENGGNFDVNPYPINSIYMSVNSTSPAYYFGGSWERIRDKFLMAAGNSYTAGTEGGSTSHNHGLTNGFAKFVAADLSNSFVGSAGIVAKSKGNVSWTTDRGLKTNSIIYDNSLTATTGTELGGSTDNNSNLPPYLTVYVWKRIS